MHMPTTSLSDQYYAERGKIAEHRAMTATKTIPATILSLRCKCAWCDVM